MSAAARRVPFFPRDHETRAHDVLLAASRKPPALAHAHAAQRRARKTPVIVGKFEMRLRFPGAVFRAKPQIFVNPIGIHDLPRIHLPVWIPNGLELPKGLQKVRPEHLAEKFSSRLTVAMLA